MSLSKNQDARIPRVTPSSKLITDISVTQAATRSKINPVGQFTTGSSPLLGDNIPFNRPYLIGREIENIREAHAAGHLAGNGKFTRKCEQWIRRELGVDGALLTHSCTAALEMAAILANIGPGDEVIMPSFTFVSTANAFALRGAVPVFVDIRPDTLNLDEKKIQAAITKRTRAIVPVHYAGVPCDMDAINNIAKRNRLMVIEDAAQAFLSNYRGRPAGSFGQLAAFSFHETKNVISGEGGALVVNDKNVLERAEIVREKGTDRSRFMRGQVDKYTWVDLGSSYVPAEIISAFLDAQLDSAREVTNRRLTMWANYHEALQPAESTGKLRRPVIPSDCEHNAHMYQVLMPDLNKRSRFISMMKKRGVNCVFHYVPLHSSPAGRRYGKASGAMDVTDSVSERLVRLPLWCGMEDVQDQIISSIRRVLSD